MLFLRCWRDVWGFGSLVVGGIAVVVIVVRGMSLKVARAAQGWTCFTGVSLGGNHGK